MQLLSYDCRYHYYSPTVCEMIRNSMKDLFLYLFTTVPLVCCIEDGLKRVSQVFSWDLSHFCPKPLAQKTCLSELLTGPRLLELSKRAARLF